MMRILLLLSVCCSALLADATYFLFPEGKFEYCGQSDRFFIYDREFRRFVIYKDHLAHGQEIGTIEIPENALTQTYTLHIGDELVAKHQAYFISLGALAECLKDFEVTDAQGNRLGYIEGKWFTNTQAKFLLYNDQFHHFASATLNDKYNKLLIQTPDDQLIATCKKTFETRQRGTTLYTSKPKYYWTISIADEDLFDERLCLPLITFIADKWWRENW